MLPTEMHDGLRAGSDFMCIFSYLAVYYSVHSIYAFLFVRSNTVKYKLGKHEIETSPVSFEETIANRVR